jgi:flavin-dependent thymidylate synthase
MERGYEVKVLDHGYVRLIDFMGSDESIIEAARMSTGKGFVSWSSYQLCKKCGVAYGKEKVQPLIFDAGGKYIDCQHDWEKYPNGDLGLLDNLWRKKHATPFEMCELAIEVQAPIFVFREWHRHRTQCLAGDTRLHFDLPGGIERRGTQKYTMTIKEVFEKFQPTTRNERPERQENALFPRQRIQAMRLRCVNEETKEVTHTSIVDVWESGKKQVFDVMLGDLGTIRCSADHRFFTTEGWLTLKEIVDLPELGKELYPGRHSAALRPRMYLVHGKANESLSFEVPAREAEEQWESVRGWESWYEVSNMGRVRRIAGGQGVRTQGTCKRLTPNMAGYLTTNLNRPGEQKTVLVHALVLEAFQGPCPEGMECRHLDGNQMNNWASNLKWGTSQENADDRSRHGRTPSLKVKDYYPTYIKSVGEEMTYDIEVAEPWHNFVAEGFVVHNSYNEFSARYAQMQNLHYIPELSRIQKQSAANKQGSAEVFPEKEAESIRMFIEAQQDQIYESYDEWVEKGLAKEIARVNTPVSRYSKMRAKTDLRSWLMFLNLRMRPDAQWEIRQYAQEVAVIIGNLFPKTWALFMEYDLYGAHLSRTELIVLRDLLQRHMSVPLDETNLMDDRLKGTKAKEFIHKLRVGGESILA